MGVEKQVIRPGTGPKPTPGQTVTVHCTGYGWDEGVMGMQVAEVARLRKRIRVPVSICCVITYVMTPQVSVCVGFVGNAISCPSVRRGSLHGLMKLLMDLFYTCLQCSPDYAYGAGGFPTWGIQPNSVLEFEIEVLSLK
ncbi:peptidyl-prolyl cis-trans isomerase FKBP12 [Gossypium australe]|uniref:peptidylprolyl isomerase n=1 Tax=Gossypium australe TaxID=47621 RepID=A0A5B6WN88_9ROSI|nr:peptidyl-prolyl cis-trans isomerase FKBP12 [Gossypium australe]